MLGEVGEMSAECKQFRAEVAERREVKTIEACLSDMGVMSWILP